MPRPTDEWPLARYETAIARLESVLQSTRDHISRCAAQLRISLELLEKPYRAYLEKLRVELAECELIRDLATSRDRRDQVPELAKNRRASLAESEKKRADPMPVSFLGRRTYKPFPEIEAASNARVPVSFMVQALSMKLNTILLTVFLLGTASVAGLFLCVLLVPR